MNGLGLPAAQPTVAELRAQLAVAEACEPIERELQEAKAAYREALESGDPEVIAAAKQRKAAAAHAINETRTWLRREARIARLQTAIPETEARLAGRLVDEHGCEDTGLRAELEAQLAAMREELTVLEADAVPYRELFGAAPSGPPVIVEDGSAQVDMPAVRVKAKPMRGGE